MFDYVCIRALDDCQHTHDGNVMVEWGLLRGDGTIAEPAQRTTLSELAAALPEDSHFKTIFLVQGESVLLTGVSIPARQTRQLYRALPFVVEEQVAEDIEKLHLAVGPKLDNGEIMVAAVQHDLMLGWINLLSEVGLQADYIMPDSLLLPVQKDGLNIFIDGDRALIALAAHQAMNVDRENLSLVLDILLTENEDLNKISFMLDAENLDQHGMELSTIEAELEEHDQLAIEIVDITDTSFEYLSRLAVLSKKDLNLLQGQYKVQTHQGGAWQQWRPVAIAAAVCLALQVTFDIGKGYYFDREAQQMQQKSHALYRELFGEGKKIVNLRHQVKSHLKGAAGTGEDSGFLNLLGDAATQLKAMKKGQSVEIHQMRYDKKKQELMFELRAKSIDHIETYKELLTKAGMNVKILSANEQNDGIRGRMQISG